MVSSAMVMEEKHGGLSTEEKVLLGSLDEFPPKVRKPYTITKQRERWSEDEHKKFLEALNLYGRAWRKIEEHVGTKTAVQIRSHAQKFFSKVVRESNTGDATSVKAIEIPPPRPKRKPMHPYPRKLVSTEKTPIMICKKPTWSASPNISEQDNQSPTSVMSAVGSDSSVGLESGTTPNGSHSSSSSSLTRNVDTLFDSEGSNKLLEGAVSSLPDHRDENASQDNEQIPLMQELKLFGKTLLVMDTNVQSNPASETCKPKSFDTSEGNRFPWRTSPLKFPTPMNFPWLTRSSNPSDSSPTLHGPTSINAYNNEKAVNEKRRDVSSTDAPALLRKIQEPTFFSYKPSSANSRKGFVPYKRCLSEKDPTIFSTNVSDERDKQRSRLCL